MNTPPALRWFWRIYIPIALLVMLGMLAVALGNVVEERVWPVRGPAQDMQVIERRADRLCWAWTFTKLRDVASDNIDAFLLINGQPGGVSMVYEMASGRPWGLTKYAVAPRSEPYTINECAPLPPYVRATDTVVLRQVAYYPGLLGWWRLSVPFPDVVSPGGPPTSATP